MRRFMTALIAVGALAAGSGCIIVSDGEGNGTGDPVERADLTVLYTFGGLVLDGAQDCTEVGIDTVRVVIDGVDVSDGTVKEEACSSFFQGMTVQDLMVGSYDVSVSAKDSTGAVLYSMDSPRQVQVDAVDGGEIDVDVPSLFGSLTLWWMSFGDIEGGGRCSAAEVTDVRVVLYDSAGSAIADESFPCDQEGVVWDFLAPGSYEVVLNGMDQYGYVLYAGEEVVTVGSGQDNTYEIDLDKIVGDLTLYWRFDGSTSCGSVEQIQVYLYDPWDELYDSAVYDCSEGGISYQNLVSGDWLVTLEGLGSSNQVLFRTEQGGVLVPVEPDDHMEYYVDLY